ncbi:unnamed protein product [Brassica napus]|uniref:Uncharacterized protein n=2 Tax=Brassica TaxID=3705 RepID=A0A3P6EPC7_BRAOL|nr:unnamed protein product [Brassica napus]VDD35445.1 unnamed protein product [Brassica oleracea]
MFLLQVVNTLCVRGVISLGVGATGSVTVLIIDIFWPDPLLGSYP